MPTLLPKAAALPFQKTNYWGGGEGEEHKIGSQSWEEGKMAEGRAGWGWSQALTDLQFYLN